MSVVNSWQINTENYSKIISGEQSPFPMTKMCERVAKERWMKHLEENAVITMDQFGFRKGGSCVSTNLVCLYSRVIGIIQERGRCCLFRSEKST